MVMSRIGDGHISNALLVTESAGAGEHDSARKTIS